jgi:hypothetical protein
MPGKTFGVARAGYRLFGCAALALSAFVGCGDSRTPTPGDEDLGVLHDALTKGATGAKVGDSDYCDNASNKCALGEGDCDNSTQCATGLVCVAGNLAKRGPYTGDACAPSYCGNGVKDGDESSVDCGGSCGANCFVTCDAPNGATNKCSSDCLCGVGEGDCNTSSQCQLGLVCGSNNGPLFQLQNGVDVCWAATCQNSVKDGDETAVDCGGSCAPCAAPAAGDVALAAGGLAVLPIVISNNHTSPVAQDVLDIANELRAKLNAMVAPGGTPWISVETSATPHGISLGINGDFAGTGWPYEGYFRATDLNAGGVLRPERLAQREQYVLRTPAGSNRVIVAGATLDALRDAVWDLLKYAGYRHYFQTPTWEVIPSTPSLSLSLAVDEKPAFVARQFTFQRSLHVWDTAFGNANTAEQADWRKHNRLGGITELDTIASYNAIMAWWATHHGGGAFPAQLTTNPTASNSGRQFCLTSSFNLGGTQYTAQSVVAEWAANQNSTTTLVVPISPNGVTWASSTSGSGLYCNDINDPTYANIANREAALANAVAAVQPNKVISMRTTMDAVEPPTLALRQNVFPEVVSTYESFAVDGRISSWGVPAKEVGVSDFLAAAGNEIPGDVSMSTVDIVDRISKYYSLGVRQYAVDVNVGWAIPGPSVWALSQALWDADGPLSGESYRDDFFNHAFGPASGAARKYYDALEKRPIWSEDIIGVMYGALQDGLGATSDLAIQNRLGDLALYTRYLELYRKFWYRCSGSAPRLEQSELQELITLLYSTRDAKLTRSHDVAAV